MNRITMTTEGAWHVASVGIAFLLLSLGHSPVARATSYGVVPRPEIETVRLDKNVGRGEVEIRWSDGVGPYAVVRSQVPTFREPVGLSYVAREPWARSVVDKDLDDGRTYYYLVADDNSPTEVFQVRAINGAAVIHEGDTIVICGVGFSPNCAENRVLTESEVLKPMGCSTTVILARLPVPGVSGSLMVISPNGQSSPVRMDVFVGLSANPVRETPHFAFEGRCNQHVGER